MKIRDMVAIPCMLGVLLGSAKFCGKPNEKINKESVADSMDIVMHNDSVIKIYEQNLGKNAIDILNGYKAFHGIKNSQTEKKYRIQKENLERMKGTRSLVNQLGLKYELVKDSNNVEHCIIKETPISNGRPYVVAPNGVLF